MIRSLKKRKKVFALFFTLVIIFQTVGSSAVYALTSGPSQPEVQSFQPAGVTDMVDPFTGDFSYNIPLFELPGPNGGYPFSLSYQAGIGMDQEASWVGLGWNLQPGAITRQMRGLPDEFKGDEIKTKMSIDPSITVGLGAGSNVEAFGGMSFGLGFSVYQNSFKGVGYSIDGTVGFEKTSKGMTTGLGLGLSLDSQEGVGVNPSLSLGGEIGEFGLGVGYNSRQGLTNMSMAITTSATVTGKDKIKADSKGDPVTKKVTTRSSSSSSLSLAHPGYTPQITMPMKNTNVSLTLKGGVSWWGIFGAGYVTGFYSVQSLAQDGKWVPSDGYGYLNYQHAGGADMLDFNREKDGMVSKETPNLGIPSLTYDIYSVTGQGISMMYRPLRNDYGIVYDPQTSSVSNAVGLGVDVAPAQSHVGVNLDLNHSQSTSGKWSDDNQLSPLAAFQKKTGNDLYEPWYFKVHGEPSGDPVANLSAIGGEKAVRLKLTGSGDVFTANARLMSKDQDIPAPGNSSVNRERKPRSGAITPITNEELLTAGGEEIIPYFKIDYINRSGQEVHYSRTGLEKHHFAGYTALTGEGLRYVYAIPAYNHTQEEAAFSTLADASSGRVDVNSNSDGDPVHDATDTDKFLKKTILPAYAHSFLLTAIIGPDYVDVTNNGVTKDDLGYWVKFTYQQRNDKANPYKWRDPYSRAHFQEGWKSDPRDNRGSFTYGEKETWYMARAETKSHIAEFVTTARDDSRGVSSKFQTTTDAKGDPVYRLNSILLYTRVAGSANPIKTTFFEYDYSLCKSVENNVTSGNGKLTLKKLWFTYGGSSRGSLNPYNFSYNNETVGTAIAYNINAYDRWGNYKPAPAGKPVLYNQDFPYAEQDPTQKASIDANAAAWSLKNITLPSGGQIAVEYESDDYAYVQQKTAMQMTALVDPGTALPGGTLPNSFSINASSTKVRFKLEQPITGPLQPGQDKQEVLKYIDTKTWQLYFKLYMKLRRSTEAFDEYICGYADINTDQNLMGLEQAVTNGPYVYGYFHVNMEGGKHPFSMRAWQHLRTNQPELASTSRELTKTDDATEQINQIKSLGGLGAHIRQMFEGFNDYCNGQDWGKTITADKSWIRLNSPDKIKYGGGIRVKQIAIKDQWAEDYEGIYGQVYDYTLTEDGKKISSGVAAYEPVVGGDENALHFAKKYVQSIPMRSDNNLFFEYPINESYYPGPQVGYRRVAVMSLPSAALSGKTLANLNQPDGKGVMPTAGTGVSYGTSGMTVHEFYTAKDFPVITDETEKTNKQYKLSVPVPFVGTLSIVKLAATQGYSIITNDMHGKVKKVSNYRQTKTGEFESEPMSWVKYNYLSEQKVRDKEQVSVLLNTLVDNGDGTLSKATPADLSNGSVPKCYLAQESEFFHDMRQFQDNALGGGARYNTDIVYIPFFTGWVPIPIPVVWPNIGQSTTQLRTAVSNKIIFRSGILESVEATDGSSVVITRNLKWDKLTGTTVLTSVNNNFDAPVFNYTLPAYTEYQGMGGAYQNIGLTFTMSSVQKDPYKDELYQFYSSLPDDVLYPGDEILLFDMSSDFVTPLAKVIYMGNYEEDEIIFTDQALTANNYRCMIVRSGRRNQLSVAAGIITGLDDPSVKGPVTTYTKTIAVPK